MIAFWATPIMTLGHLVFAAATTAYMLVAIQLEERDLVRMYGDAYRDYRGVGTGFPKRTCANALRRSRNPGSAECRVGGRCAAAYPAVHAHSSPARRNPSR